MKGKIWAILGLIFFVLVILNTVTVLYFYKQYNANIDTINQENGLTRAKIEGLEKDSEAFKSVVETVNSQLKSYEQTILTLENKVNASESAVNDVSSKMEKVKVDIDEWQKKYGSALEQVIVLKDVTEKLVDDVEQLKKFSSGNVNLGKIAVQGEDTTAKGSKKK